VSKHVHNYTDYTKDCCDVHFCEIIVHLLVIIKYQTITLFVFDGS